MTRFSQWIAPAALIGASVAGAASAQVTYDYAGNDFTYIVGGSGYTTSDSISGSFSLGSVLGDNLNNAMVDPTSYSFSDGVQVLNNANSEIANFSFSTNAKGAITGWDVDLIQPGYPIIQTASSPLYGSEDYADHTESYEGFQAQNHNPGVWSVTSAPAAAPEIDPATATSGLSLLAGGLLVLRGRRQRPLAA